MKIILKKSNSLTDWYTIVRAEHDGREWFEMTGENSSRFMSSERLSPEACIEGSASEMIAIARAIKNRESVSFRRCAVVVHFEKDEAHFCSPRNSVYDAIVPLKDADDFAEQVLCELVEASTRKE